MWPWEHAILGYLAYSLLCRVRYGEPPSSLGTVVVVFASVLPDLIDKPLVWSFGVTDTGYAIGHSMFFAVPLAFLAWFVASSAGRARVGIGFGIGYLLHLPADVLFRVAIGGGFRPEIVLWPVATYDTSAGTDGFLRESIDRVESFWLEALAGELSIYLSIQLVLATLVFCLWLFDGAPVARDIVNIASRLVRA